MFFEGCAFGKDAAIGKDLEGCWGDWPTAAKFNDGGLGLADVGAGYADDIYGGGNGVDGWRRGRWGLIVDDDNGAGVGLGFQDRWMGSGVGSRFGGRPKARARGKEDKRWSWIGWSFHGLLEKG